jgi:predicted PurR-regulated permease PerM
MSAPEYPTPWQRKTLWMAFTTLAVVVIGGITVGLIWLVFQVLGFLQPILVPFAIAGVLAYLLNPVVTKIVSWGTSRHRAVFAVFAVVSIVLAGMLVWILPALTTQSINLARKIPGYTKQVKMRVEQTATFLHEKYGLDLLPLANANKQVEGPPAPTVATPPQTPAELAASKERSEKTTPREAATTGTADLPPAVPGEPATSEPIYDLQQFISGDWLQSAVRQGITQIIHTIQSSLGGFLGIIGFLVSLVIVPIYLYYFLIEGPTIEKEWGNYLPLRASAFKDEVVSTLNEINGYLIAFFRGQLVVSLINGTITGIGLVVVGLEFGLLIGLALCVLGIIPYIGIAMCWVVAVIIASVQGGSWCVVGQDWWVFPVLVSAIFVVVHYFDGLFITPRIVGESVGLHPATVIFSVFAWSLLMGGLLGAILAVPMTATLKVLLRRFVWERRFRGADSVILPPVEQAITATVHAPPQTSIPVESVLVR